VTLKFALTAFYVALPIFVPLSAWLAERPDARNSSACPCWSWSRGRSVALRPTPSAIAMSPS